MRYLRSTPNLLQCSTFNRVRPKTRQPPNPYSLRLLCYDQSFVIDLTADQLVIDISIEIYN